ncbi:uncharacterized protein LOC124289395 [Haliotis rubra]|uniref:uncharacterized protein LOC124289395 n=1 Tax=Haliotis rubra TaxID=36100 RepID=UPI001EE5657F|nr:uncharacterized protein LOC124289395 [Haliotis rubra]
MAELMTLYWHPLFGSVRVIWLIKEDFRLIRYKPNTDVATNIAYRRDVHPHGTIPALVVPGEGTVLKSGAINMYLADRYKKLLPDPKFLKDYYDFIVYANTTLDELLETSGIPAWTISPSDWRAEGRGLTAADCVVGYDIYIYAVLRDGELLQNHPRIRKYYDRLKSRSAFQETIRDDQSYLNSFKR